VASRKRNTVIDINNVDTSVLPSFVISGLQNQAEVKMFSDEELADVIARAVGRRFYKGDYEGKNFFLAVAQSTPDAYKLYYDVEYMGIPETVVEQIDVRQLLRNFAANPEVSGEFRSLAEDEIQRTTQTYVDYFVQQGEGGQDAANTYFASGVDLSPRAFLTSSVTEKLPDGTTNPLEAQGMQTGDFEGSGSTMVTQEGEGFRFRTDASRTIDTMINDMESISGGEYFFNLEGMAMPSEGPFGAQGWSPRAAIDYIYKLDENQLLDLQSSLAQAGYFERTGTRYRAGEIDGGTKQAWKLLLNDAIAYETKPSQMLGDQIKNYNRRKRTEMLGVQRKDESEIFNIARDTGLSLLGRGLNERELATLTEKFREWETDIAAADWMFMDPEATALNLQEKTEEYLRNQFEADYLTNQISDFLAPYGRAFQ